MYFSGFSFRNIFMFDVSYLMLVGERWTNNTRALEHWYVVLGIGVGTGVVGLSGDTIPWQSDNKEDGWIGEDIIQDKDWTNSLTL